MIKTISASLSRADQEASLNEVRLLASVDHPRVVRYYDSFVDGGRLHIVMEHCERGDLAMLLEARAGAPLAEGEVWAHLLQTASGLHHLHSRKVLHRDLKAKNLFLAADGVKIGDLGVARLLGASTEFASTVVGTPYYLSPELCENAPYNEKSDVWALGVVLYEMLALRRPFEARNQGALLLKILRAEYAPPPAERYTPPLLALLGRCLQRDPAARARRRASSSPRPPPPPTRAAAASTCRRRRRRRRRRPPVEPVEPPPPPAMPVAPPPAPPPPMAPPPMPVAPALPPMPPAPPAPPTPAAPLMPVAAARHPRTPGGYAARHAEAMESARCARGSSWRRRAGPTGRPSWATGGGRRGARGAGGGGAAVGGAARRARRAAARGGAARAAEAMAAAEEASAARRERERAALAAGIAACESRLSAEAMLGGASTVASEVVGAAGGVGAAEAVVGTLRAAEVAAAAEAGMSGWDAAVMSSWDAGDATDGEPSDVSLTADEATDDDASDGGADDAATASDDEHGRHTRRATPSPPHLEVGWRVLDGAEGEGGDDELRRRGRRRRARWRRAPDFAERGVARYDASLPVTVGRRNRARSPRTNAATRGGVPRGRRRGHGDRPESRRWRRGPGPGARGRRPGHAIQRRTRHPGAARARDQRARTDLPVSTRGSRG